MQSATIDPLGQQLAIAGQMLQQGQAAGARALLKRLHKANPKHTDIMLQLAIAERLLKHWPNAIALLKKAHALAPSNLTYIEQLAMVQLLSNDGREMIQSIGHSAAVLRARPDFFAVGSNIILASLRNDLPKPILDNIPPLLNLPMSDTERLHYAAACTMAAYLVNDVEACAEYAKLAISLRQAAHDAEGKPVMSDLYFMLIYAEFIDLLLKFRADHPALYAADANAKEFHIIGESHALTPSQLLLQKDGQAWKVKSHLVMGALAYFFTVEGANSVKFSLEEAIRRIPKEAPIIVGFGELDCRPRAGVMAQYRATPGYLVPESVDALCASYVRFVKIAQLKRLGRTFIAGVPAPKRTALADLEAGEETVFTGLIATFNAALKREAAKQELGFVDIYAATVGEGGWAKEGVHIDHVHLKPSVVKDAIEAA